MGIEMPKCCDDQRMCGCGDAVCPDHDIDWDWCNSQNEYKHTECHRNSCVSRDCWT